MYLNENNKVNAIMYADDLVIIAQSEVELQSSLTQLSIFCENWKLEINTKKSKYMVFNRGNKLCKANIVINAKHIENVKYTKYLGFTISSKKCTFANTFADLSTKAHRAVFALNSRIKLSMLPPRLALKIVSTQICYMVPRYGLPILISIFLIGIRQVLKEPTQFLKRILGCDIHSPNHMVRGELGKRPLLSDAIR